MQRVVRSTLVGLLTIAGLTACGDKVTVPPQVVTTTPSSNVVRSVTVSPATAGMNVGDKLTFTASVNADAGVTDRTVTWSSSDATIASVDANGLVTALKAGTASIIAKSKADPTVQGAGVVTVAATNAGAPATVTISTINNTVCAPGAAGGFVCSSVPANLGNVAGQLDVTLNVDPGGQKLSNVQLLMNCGGADTVVAQQTLTTAAIAVEAASAPVTLSFNTAAFTSGTGATAFKNGQCVLKARATTTTGTTVASSNTNLTLNNADVVIGSITSTKTALNPVTNLVWNGGDVTVTATPVMFSGRVPATMTITFECRTVTVTGTGTKTATFVDANDAPANQSTAGGCAVGATPPGGNATPAANDIDNITDPAATATFTLVDAAGQGFTTNPCGAGAQFCTSTSVLAGAPAAVTAIRLDTQRPPAGTINLASNTLQNTSLNGFVSNGFRFAADSAAGFVGPNANTATGTGTTCVGAVGGINPVTCNYDNGGVDNVTVTFQFSTARTGTFTTITSASSLSETVAGNTNILREITTDALGNADTSYVAANGGTPLEFASITTNGGVPASSRFGVDKTAPAATVTAGPANQAQAQAVGGTGSYVVTITDALSGPAPQQLVAQVVLNGTVNSSSGGLPANNTIFTNTNAAGTQASGSAASRNSGCIIGRFNRNSGAANASADALPVFDVDGTQIGTCSPTPYNMAGGTTIPANANGTSGYYTTRLVAIDEAGNRTIAFTNQVVEDGTNPTAGPGIDFPQTLSGGATATFPTRANDNLDVVGSFVQLNYPQVGMRLQYPVVAGPGVAFDNVLTGLTGFQTVTVNPTASPFLRSLQPNAGASTRPSTPTAAQGATAVNVGVLDEVSRSGQTGDVTNFQTLVAVSYPSSNPWSSDFNAGSSLTVDNSTLSDCPTAGCANSAAPANPTSATFTASAAGTTGLLTNPFTQVQFWYRVNNAGPWFLAGTSTSSTSRDTGVGGFRFWDYTFTWTPPKSAPVDPATNVGASLTAGASIQMVAIGINGSGDGVVGPVANITLTNP